MVVKNLWRKGDANSRKINLKFYYHPDCNTAAGLDYLNQHPYTSGSHKRGPKRTVLTPEQQHQRYLLLRRKASLEQRKRKLKAEFPDRLLKEANIDEKIADLMIEIAGVGGIPNSWISKMQTRSM
jgi:hypothetical protein